MKKNKNVKIKDKKKSVKVIKTDEIETNIPLNRVNIKVPADSKALCIILGEGKGAKLLWVDSNTERFSYNKNTYFILDDGMFLTRDKIRVCVYLEGISTPLSQRYIKRETKERIIKIEGKKDKKIKVAVIKGLKFDSKIMDVLLNRGLAQIFTNIREDKIVYVVFFLVIVSIIVGVINVGVSLSNGGTI